MAATTKKKPAKKTPAKRKPPATKTSPTAAAATATAGSEFRAELPIKQLVKHPKNPRHRAVADPDLVASVTAKGILQPLVVAPVGNEDTFMLIAGHRREHAARKAGLKTVPVIIRRDLATEADQVEAMLIENLHRDGLTAIEEAEGYATLELAGLKPAAIAAKVGRDVTTVRSRLKLLKLSASTRKRVHAGQLTIADATALVEFADDPAATERLERAARANDGWSLKQELSAARRRRDAARDVAVRTAKLLDAGATQLELPADASAYSWTREGGRAPLDATHSADWGQHQGCLAFVTSDDAYRGPQLYEICTDAARHREQLDTEARQRAEEAEAQIKARQEQSLAEAAAADTRVSTLMDLAAGITIDHVLGDLARTLLPAWLRDLHGSGLTAYQHAMRIPAEDRWGHLGLNRGSAINETRFAHHVDDLVKEGNSYAARALVALLVSAGERATEHSWQPSDCAQALEYFSLLEEAGHAFSPIDTELREQRQAKVDAAEKKAS